jgi:hypothetical protein
MSTAGMLACRSISPLAKGTTQMFIIQSCNRMGDWNTIACPDRAEAKETYAEERNDSENVMVALEDGRGNRLATATRDVAGAEIWN